MANLANKGSRHLSTSNNHANVVCFDKGTTTIACEDRLEHGMREQNAEGYDVM